MPTTEPPQSPPPEEKYPENFYTYRYDLIQRDWLAGLLSIPPGEGFGLRDSGGTDAPGDTNWPPGVPRDPPEEPPPPPDPEEPKPVDESRRAAVQLSARSWLEAADYWRKGNDRFEQRNYSGAVTAYGDGQNA